MIKNRLKYSDLSIEELYQIFVDSGDQEAFSIVFKKIYPSMFSFMRGLTNNEALIEDVISDYILTLLDRKHSIENLIGYTKTSLRNGFYRQSNKNSHYVEFKNSYQSTAIVYGQEEELIAEELYTAFSKILLSSFTKNKIKKEAVIMHYNGQITDEITSELNIKPQLVYNSIHSVRKEVGRFLKSVWLKK